jgi:hypothetical protein
MLEESPGIFWVVRPYSPAMAESGKFWGHGAGDVTASQPEDHDLKTNFLLKEYFSVFSGHDAVQSGRNLLMFQRRLTSIFRAEEI